MIKTFPNTIAGNTAAKAVPAPRDLWYDGDRIVVFDGDDFTARNPPASKDTQDEIEARKYGKLTALQIMTPAEVQAWVATDVKTLAQTQDAIATLAIAVSILARKL